jgi:hypothetical protein
MRLRRSQIGLSAHNPVSDLSEFRSLLAAPQAITF